MPRPNRRYRPSETAKRAQELLQSNKPKRRTQTLFPYLIIRTAPGDAGARPISPPAMPWECCDIHLIPAGIGAFDFGQTLLKPLPGETYRVFVHIWNLGRFSAYGARLRVWSVEPGFYRGQAGTTYHPKYIGGAYFNLDDRDGTNSHRLVELTRPWTVGPDRAMTAWWQASSMLPIPGMACGRLPATGTPVSDTLHSQPAATILEH